jgi:hypothetical protein
VRLLSLASTLLLSASIFAQTAPRVAFVPVINASKKTPKTLQTRQNVAAGEWLVREMERRSMRLTPIRSIKAELQNQKIDPLQLDKLTTAKWISLGQALKVDFIVATLILDSKAEKVEKPRFLDTEGVVKMKFWLIDVVREIPLLNGKEATFRSGSKHEHLVDLKGDDRQVESAAKGMKESFSEWLKGFPVKKD